MSEPRSIASLPNAQDSGFIANMEHGIQALVRNSRFQQIVFKGFQFFIHSKAVNQKQMGKALQIFCLQLFDRAPKSVLCSTCFSKPIVESDIVLKCLENVGEAIDLDLQNFCFEVLCRLLQLPQADDVHFLFYLPKYILGTLKLLKVLMISKPTVIAPVKKQMGILTKMLEFVLATYWFTARLYRVDEKLPNFLEYIQPWVNTAAVVPFVLWVEEMDEELCALLSSFVHKFYPTTPALVEVYLEDVIKLKPSEVPAILLMRKAVGCFLDILLEDLIVSTDDDFEMLSEGLSLLAAILIYPPQERSEDKKLTLRQTNLLVNEAASWICSLHSGKLREDLAKGRNILLHNLLEKIKRAKTELRQLHVDVAGNPSWKNVPQTNEKGYFDLFLGNLKKKVESLADLWQKNVPRKSRKEYFDLCQGNLKEKLELVEEFSWNNVPQTNRKGYFDFLLGNLKKKSEAEADLFPFEKHLIAIVQRELESLKPFLMNIFEAQDGHDELKDIWFRAGNAAYLVDQVTDFCLSVDAPIWSNMIHLSNAIDQIQFVKTEMTKIRENQMYKDIVVNAKKNSKLILPRREQANATIKDDFKVVFRPEEEKIIQQLKGGEDKLDIIAIVGMPGQGKTTLALRVFQNSEVKCHFHKLAWCYVSEAYDIKRILLDILKGVGQSVPEKNVSSVTEEDLADELRKCLMGQRYLIVLDDIWDFEAWDKLRLSFPNGNNGSRILFTSRNSDVAMKVKTDCCLIVLRPLSFEESWNLLQWKVFEEDSCPSTLSTIGRTIAENCKGLPLAIVLVAGLLKKDKNVDSWDRTAQSLNSQLESERCMEVLELSYMYLPDFLKPCFLYLGAFQEDQIIDAKKLIQLWIVEGFVQEGAEKSLEDVAYQYLSNLVDRSLVTVAKRSSRNEIKKCRVHDLLHMLAFQKAKEERFLLVTNVSNLSSSTRDNPYRLCIHANSKPFDDPIPTVPNLRSLLVSTGSWYYYRNRNVTTSFATFRLLKVLDLGYACVDQSQFDKITQLVHLRFLSLTSVSISKLIVNLVRLEIFYFFLSGLGRCIVPAEMMKMENIRQIFISRSEFPDVKELELYPPLVNLESLTFFEDVDDSVLKTLARQLPNLRKLGIELRSCVRLSNYFNKLESLNLEISINISPSTLDFPSTLKKLNLEVTEPLSGDMISSIGKLSTLEVLKLRAEFEDDTWDVEDDEFLNLKYLKLSYSNIQEWNIASSESLPRLEQVVLKRCHQLIELPCTFGEIPNLKRIEVRNCNDGLSSSFEQIVANQEDIGNKDLQSSISSSAQNERYFWKSETGNFNDGLSSSFEQIVTNQEDTGNEDLQSSISGLIYYYW